MFVLSNGDNCMDYDVYVYKWTEYGYAGWSAKLGVKEISKKSCVFYYPDWFW